ncbi:MAG: Rrf2 family transcriptional regulator [Bacteroidales bacterium]|nr:Rrf2 family transcriptional regulator [Bacteroidales bacterium]
MSKIVYLSEAASIGLHAMVLIAKSKKIIKVTEIAELTGSSKNHLSKVMQRLVKEGLVKSTRGPTGGFLMNKEPHEITLLNIYESIEGKVTNSGCPLDKHVCPFNKCIMDNLVKKMTDEFINYFMNQTLENYIS